MLKDFFADLGIKLPDLVAAFWGGVASVVFVRNVTPRQALSTFIVGLTLGTYMGGEAAKLLGIGTELASCLVAFAGMSIAQGITEAVRAWRPKLPGGGP